MNQNVNVPVEVIGDEEVAMLHEGIGLILSRWTAMRAAVENGWGGKNSQAKAENTISQIFDHFTLSKDPMDYDRLVDILENGLNELNTEADDGSPEEVTESLLDLYQECCVGNFQMVEKLRATKFKAKASVVKVANGDDEESDEDGDDEDTSMNDDQTTDMMVDASENSSNRKPEAMPVDEPVADDGWTVVPSRKNKGKKN
ncbi:PREDICTED: pre-rRNA-processing protein TSR2-like [Camelina sativa]|uniref:Pre-rRNA-processing protein TSR2-like n=1 Tax=Camelina sativa TaxID=90675 RepID=A0ABM0Y1J5_CAMSA|nr:PREDICTED: pre-rRNA-processing protein TSR2-like [Camelina sativa]